MGGTNTIILYDLEIPPQELIFNELTTIAPSAMISAYAND